MRFPRLLAPAALVSALLFAACGDDRTDSIDASTTIADATATATAGAPATTTAPGSSCTPAADSPTGKPTVCLPTTLPTALVVTDLTVGTGAEAKAGDILVMNYVGVRSEDGTEFDNSYDKGATFQLTLGSGQVIEGWEQGLVGIKQGGRRQLDIPADLGYGDNGSGEVIKPGDALSFVIDAVKVYAAPDPADRPAITIEGGPNVDTVQTDDLVAGTGDAISADSTAIVFLIAYRADTGEELLSSWDDGVLQELPVAQLATSLPGFAEGLTGMQVGGRRQITVPFAQGFGSDGNAQLGTGLPAETDLVLVIDLIGVEPAP